MAKKNDTVAEHAKDRDEREEREWLERIRLKQRKKGALTRREVWSLQSPRVKSFTLSDEYFESVLFELIRERKLNVVNGAYYVHDPEVIK